MLREPYEYNATLGHFANSAPDRANVWHAMIDHPRFGAIRDVVTRFCREAPVNDVRFHNFGYLVVSSTN